MRYAKVNPGDSLDIPAATYNSFVDAALDYERRRYHQVRDPISHARRTDIIRVQNVSGVACSRFGVLGIERPIINPVHDVEAFIHPLAMRGRTPISADRGRFVVLIEPVASDGIGRALISGVTAGRVKMSNERHTYADIAPGDIEALRSAWSGSAQLLWIQPESERIPSDVAWAIIRMGVTPMRAARLGIVVECNYDEVTTSLMVTCVPLRGTNRSADVNDTERIVAWAGLDPLVVTNDIVLLTPIVPLELNPEVDYMVTPVLSVDRSQLDMSDSTCTTDFNVPCNLELVDSCLG